MGREKCLGPAALTRCRFLVVAPLETGNPWDVQEEAQGHLSSLSEGFPAPWPAREGLRLCWLQPGPNQHKEAFVTKNLNRWGLIYSCLPPDLS